MEERFAYGEIERDLYVKLSTKLNQELIEKNKELEKTQLKLSNSDELIDKSIEIGCKLESYWENADIEDKKIMQKVLFPEGILFDKKTDRYRTENVNVVLEVMLKLSDDYDKKISGKIEELLALSALVARSRFELPTFGL